MKKCVSATLFFSILLSAFSQEAELNQQTSESHLFSLNSAIIIAIENNYEIKKQQYALAIAQSQFRQSKGTLDVEIGAQAQYSMKQNPVDEDDPNYQFNYSFLTPDDAGYGIYSNNTLSHQTGGSIFLKKLFNFGLQSKLSYTLQRSHNFPDFTYSDYFDALASYRGLSKYSQEMGRNFGELTLELSLPLFKSFKNSMTACQIDSARDYLNQMEYTLKETISQNLINVSKLYWDYFLAYKNVERCEILQKKIEDRNTNMSSLIAAGVRSKNDLLAMQVNVNENRRQLENLKVQYNQTKMNLMSGLGLTDSSVIGVPQNLFTEINIEKVSLPKADDFTDSMLEYIEESRPDFKALNKQKHAAELKIRLAKADSLPDANLNFGIGMTGTTYSDDFGKVISSGFFNIRGVNVNGVIGVSAKLGNNTKKGALEQCEAEYNSIINEYNRLKNTLSLQIITATEKLNTYKHMLTDADEVLKMQKNLYDNEQKRFTAGLITVDTLLNQDQKYMEAENSYYQLLVNYMQSVLEFKYYTATLVDIDSDSIFKIKNN
jgi:outer membrane protein TolC